MLVAVIVSGYDGDGAAALCAIKEVGGVTIAQKPDTAALRAAAHRRTRPWMETSSNPDRSHAKEFSSSSHGKPWNAIRVAGGMGLFIGVPS